jgi:hypothetical protein
MKRALSTVLFMSLIGAMGCQIQGFGARDFSGKKNSGNSLTNFPNGRPFEHLDRVQDNPLTQLPMMGYGTYQSMARSRYGLNWDKDPATQVWQFGLRRQEILDIADAMVNNGLLDAGYNIILIESGFWYTDTEHSDRTADGKIFPRKKLGDINSLVQTLHDKGFLVGTYSDTGNHGCGGLPGSGSHRNSDLEQFFGWGFDYLKLDHCGENPQTGNSYHEYKLWGETLLDFMNRYKRNFIYNIADWNHKDRPSGWANQFGNSWRTGYDIETYPDYKVNWSMVLRNFDYNDVPPAAGPGHWNDADSLTIGGYDLSDLEERSMFSMWAMQSAPLMLATYPLDLNPSQPQANRLKEIVLNREMIAINQDPLGRQAEKVREDNFGRVVYSKILSGSGRRAVMLLNRTESPSDISFYFSDLGLKPYSITKVRDLWTHKDIGSNGYSMTFSRVPAHASIVLVLEGSEKPVDQLLSFQNMGGKVLGTPSLVTTKDGKQILFSRGMDNNIWVRRSQIGAAQSWSAWSQLNFPKYKNRFGEDESFEFLEDFGVTARENNIWLVGAGRPDWAAHHERSVFFSYSTDSGATWSVPVLLGGDLRGHITPVLRDAYDTLDILGKGVDGAIWRKTWYYRNGTAYWGDWTRLGGCLHSGISTVARGNSYVDFSYVDCSDRLVHGYYVGDGAIQSGKVPNAPLVAGTPAIVVDQYTNYPHIFVKGLENNRIYEYVYSATSNWQLVNSLEVCSKSGISAFNRPANLISPSNSKYADVVMTACSNSQLNPNQDLISDAVLLNGF